VRIKIMTKVFVFRDTFIYAFLSVIRNQVIRPLAGVYFIAVFRQYIISGRKWEFPVFRLSGGKKWAKRL